MFSFLCIYGGRCDPVTAGTGGWPWKLVPVLSNESICLTIYLHCQHNTSTRQFIAENVPVLPCTRVTRILKSLIKKPQATIKVSCTAPTCYPVLATTHNTSPQDLSHLGHPSDPSHKFESQTLSDTQTLVSPRTLPPSGRHFLHLHHFPRPDQPPQWRPLTNQP